MTQTELLGRINELLKLVYEKSKEIKRLESVIDDDQYVIAYLKNKVDKPLIDVEEEFGIDIKYVMKVHELKKRCKEDELDEFLEEAYEYLFDKSNIRYDDDEMCDKFIEWFNNEF